MHSKILFKTVLWSLLLGLPCVGCKTTTGKSLSQAESVAVDPISKPKLFLVVSGGWGSCSDTGSPVGSRTFDSAINLINNLKSQYDVYYIISCLDKVPPQRPLATMAYMGRGIPLIAGVRATGWPRVVQEYVNLIKPTKTYFIGHSYGGWVVLDLLRKGVRAEHVFTFDPIDAERCLPISQIFNPLGFSGPSCLNAPQMEYAQFLGGTSMLHNYWQADGALHSGPIPADRGHVTNTQENVREHPYFQSAGRGSQSEYDKWTHRLIGAFGPVWTDVCQTIIRANGGNAQGCTAIDTDLNGHGVLKNPVLSSLVCSKFFPDSQTGQPTTWIVGVDDFNGGAGTLNAVRGNDTYYSKTDAVPTKLALKSQQGSSYLFAGPGAQLQFTLRQDGRTGDGVFDTNTTAKGARHVDGMFCTSYLKERDSGGAVSASPVAAGAESAGI